MSSAACRWVSHCCRSPRSHSAAPRSTHAPRDFRMTRAVNARCATAALLRAAPRSPIQPDAAIHPCRSFRAACARFGLILSPSRMRRAPMSSISRAVTWLPRLRDGSDSSNSSTRNDEICSARVRSAVATSRSWAIRCAWTKVTLENAASVTNGEQPSGDRERVPATNLRVRYSHVSLVASTGWPVR